jgi:uncharacterized protein YjdB
MSALAAGYPVTWISKKIEQTIEQGQTQQLTAIFTSTTELQNVKPWVVPGLRPYLTVEPENFAFIAPNIPHTLTLNLSIPADTPIGLYDGTVQLKAADGSRTYALPLPIELNVEDSSVPVLDFTLDEASRVSATLTPKEGGTLETTSDGIRYTLTIPPYALVEDVEVTLTAASNVTGLPLSLGMIAAVQAGPEGLLFLKPATLAIELPNPAPANCVGFLFQDNGEGFHYNPIEISGNTVTFDLMHFTLANLATGSILGTGTCEELKDRLPAALEDAFGLTSEDLAKSRIAILREFFDRCFEDDEALALVQDAMREIFYEWFFETPGIESVLDLATGDPINLGRAVSLLIEWHSTAVEESNLIEDEFNPPVPCGALDGSLCDSLWDILDTIAPRVRIMFENAITYANNRCPGAGLPPDAEALELLGLAYTLAEEGVPFFAELEDTDALFDLKTCGIRSLGIEPTSLSLIKGGIGTIRAIAKDKNGNELFGYDNYIEWYSSNESVAWPDVFGNVLAVGKGTAEIWLYLSSPSYGFIRADLGPEVDVCVRLPVESVVITPPEKTLQVGDTWKLTAIGRDANGDFLTCPVTFSWTPQDPAIVGIQSSSGAEAIVEGVSVSVGGPVQVTATADGESGVALINVTEPPGDTYSITAEATVKTGEEINLVLRDDSGNPLPQDRTWPATWSSSDEGIASLEPHYTRALSNVIGFRAGVATVTVVIDGQTLTATVNVQPELFVEAKYGRLQTPSDSSRPCSWTSSLNNNCEIPSNLDFIPLTVRAGYRQVTGFDPEYGYPGWENVWTEDVPIDVGFLTIGQEPDPAYGMTDENAEFETIVYDYDLSSQHEIIAQIAATYPATVYPPDGSFEFIEVKAIAKEFCDLPYARAPELVEGEPSVETWPTGISYGQNSSMTVDYGSIDGSVLTFAEEVPPSANDGQIELSRGGRWDDSLLIVPIDPSLYGKRIWLRVGVDTVIAGSYEGVGEPGTHGGQAQVQVSATGHVDPDDGNEDFVTACYGPFCYFGESKVASELRLYHPDKYSFYGYIGFPLPIGMRAGFYSRSWINDVQFLNLFTMASANISCISVWGPIIEVLLADTDEQIPEGDYDIISCSGADY